MTAFLLYTFRFIIHISYSFSSLKIGDARSIRRADAAEIFKAYDGSLNGSVKISNFGFIFKDLVQFKHISSKLFFRDVVARLDEEKDGSIYLNAFIAWIESVRVCCLFCCILWNNSQYYFSSFFSFYRTVHRKAPALNVRKLVVMHK